MANRRKPPTWAVIVGVLGICFGAVGTISGAYGLLTPAMLSMQRELVVAMRQSMPAGQQCAPGSTASPRGNLATDPAGFLERLLSVPHWYEQWSVGNSIAQLVLGAAYLLSALLLLLMRRGAPAAFMLAAAASLVRNLVSAGLSVTTASLIAYWALGSALCGIIVDMALLATVAFADKSAYRGAGSEE